MKKYLMKRGNYYQFVMRVPTDLVPEYGRARIQTSLKTTRYEAALREALLLKEDIHEAFAKKRKELRLDDKNRSELIQRLLYGRNKSPTTNTISLLSDHFINERRCNWADKTLLNYQQSLRYFASFLPKHQLRNITRKNCRDFKSLLLKVPKNRSNEEARLPIKDIVHRSNGRETMSQKRVNMLLECISAFMKWAVINDYASLNPMEGIKAIVPKKQSRKSRRSWKSEELDKLFSSPLYSGSAHLRRRSTPGDTVIKDYLYWLPIVALYTGARAEELCQLHRTDLKQSDGIYYLDIKETEDDKRNSIQQLKNQSSVRKVPVHDLLIKLGFVKWVENSAHMMLFQLDNPGSDGKWSNAFSKMFGRYKRAVGFDDTGLVFHSFRHNVMNFYKQTSADQSLVRQLVGHSEQSLSLGQYTDVYNLETMREFINKLEYAIDIESSQACRQQQKQSSA